MGRIYSVALLAALFLSFSAGAEQQVSISGRVLNGATGRGAEDVLVVAGLGVWEFKGSTDDKGYYRIRDLRPGTYTLTYTSRSPDLVQPVKPQTEITVRRGEAANVRDISLPKSCTVSGTVRTEKKGKIRPLPDIAVEYDIPDPKPEWGARHGGMQTGYKGAFLFNGLPAAREFILSVKVNGHADIRKVLTLEPGNTEDLTITVAWSDPSGIAGTIRNAQDGRWLEDVLVLLRDASGEQAGRAVTNEYGEYSVVGMQPGAYEATAYWQGGDPVSRQVVIVAGKRQTINFDFGKPGEPSPRDRN